MDCGQSTRSIHQSSGQSTNQLTNYPIIQLPDALPDAEDMITPVHYMLLSAALFIIGVVGVMVRKNIIIIFMSIELILNAVNINLVAFSAQLQNGIGQVFAIFVIAVAAAEAAVGLGIILAFYRNKETINIDEMNLMRS